MPGNDDSRMALVFRALADPTRRRLLDRLHAVNGQTLGELCQDLGMTRQGITQHLAVLEAAGPIATIRRGREKLHYLNPVPLQEICDRWIAKFERPDLDALSSLKRRLEGETMDRPTLVYVTYIATSPDKVFDALTDPDMTGEYWGHRNVSTWKKGDEWNHERLDGSGSDIVGTILEIDRPHRLVHTWSDPSEVGRPERMSRVTYDIEAVRGVVRLTVTHDDLPLEHVSDVKSGWPMVLSSLKSFLETGVAMKALVQQSA